MSFIFPDPFLSEEQSFDSMLVGLEYKTRKQETPVLQPCGIAHHENSPFAARCAVIKSDENYSDKQIPGTEIENVPHWDSWIEELLDLDFTSHEKSQKVTDEPRYPRTINHYSLSQILEMPVGNDQILGTNVCCSGSDIKIKAFDYSSYYVEYPEEANIAKFDKFTTIEANSDCPDETVEENDSLQQSSLETRQSNLSNLISTLNSVQPSEVQEEKSSSYFEKKTTDFTVQSGCEGTAELGVTNKNYLPKKERRTYRTRKPRLCQFLVDVLSNPEKNPSMMEWIDETDGIFRFTNSAAVARMWGLRRHKPDMKFENFARSLRTYIAKGELRKLRSKLVYAFTRPEKWFPRQHTTRNQQEVVINTCK